MRPELFSPVLPNPPSQASRRGASIQRMLRSWVFPAALAAAAVAAGCDDDTAGPEHRHQASQLTMSQTSLELQVGQQAQLGAGAVCGCGQPMEVGLVWESDNLSVATVSKAGLVTAMASGNATITANAAGLKATATITVPLQPEQLGYSLRSVTPGLEIQRLEEGHIALRIARTGGFDGTVTLSAEAVPAGLGVTFSKEAVSDNFAEVFFTAGNQLPAGTHLVTIVGSAEGFLPHSLQVAVNVVRPETGDFLLKPDPEWITVGRGSAATTTILVMRTDAFGFGWVGLDVSDAPAGFTWEFDPADGDQFTASTLTIRVANGVALGTYDLAVHGIFEMWNEGRWTHVHVTVVDLPELPEAPKR